MIVEKVTSKMMQYNRSRYCNIQRSSTKPVLWDINKKVTYFTFFGRKPRSLQSKDKETSQKIALKYVYTQTLQTKL